MGELGTATSHSAEAASWAAQAGGCYQNTRANEAIYTGVYLGRVLPGVGGPGGRVVVSCQVVEAGVGLGAVEVRGRARVVAGARSLRLGVVVGVEEGRRKISGGHGCDWK